MVRVRVYRIGGLKDIVASKEQVMNATDRLVEVKRIPVPVFGPFDYASARAEVNAALAAGQDVQPIDGAIVILQRVALRGDGRAAQ